MQTEEKEPIRASVDVKLSQWMEWICWSFCLCSNAIYGVHISYYLQGLKCACTSFKTIPSTCSTSPIHCLATSSQDTYKHTCIVQYEKITPTPPIFLNLLFIVWTLWYVYNKLIYKTEKAKNKTLIIQSIKAAISITILSSLQHYKNITILIVFEDPQGVSILADH